MLNKGTGFARYSKNLCWIVAVICGAVSVLSFTGDSGNATLMGALWLALAVAFSVSAMALGKGESAAPAAGDTGE